MGATPDELRNEVEARRAHLAQNVDRLADRITPSRVVHRRADAARRTMTGIKERVMGPVHDSAASTRHAADATGDTAARLGRTAQGGAAQLGESVRRAPEQVRRRTQGSPLGAGLVAFGAGLLAAALLPASRIEERGGERLREHPELLEPVKRAALDTAREVRDDLHDPAARAVRSVEAAARQAADTTAAAARDAGQHAAQELRATGRETAHEVRDGGHDGPDGHRLP
ncbi:DUF3618 domain-containing protein [Kitasatospora sp. NPDC004272]